MVRSFSLSEVLMNLGISATWRMEVSHCCEVIAVRSFALPGGLAVGGFSLFGGVLLLGGVSLPGAYYSLGGVLLLGGFSLSGVFHCQRFS